jgi:predicted ATPase
VLTALRLVNFKSFRDATLHLGPLALLMGTNASGKSNLRDAFRFLHGISRGYTVAEILGEKWIEGGVLQWKGIRGGTREATFMQAPSLRLEAEFSLEEGGRDRNARYQIEVDLAQGNGPPRVLAERLMVGGHGAYVFDTDPQDYPTDRPDRHHLSARVRQRARGLNPALSFLSQQPLLSQVHEHPKVQPQIRELVRASLQAFSGMRFLDLAPDAMTRPSVPGQTVLGDRGENLSSVLQALCEDPARKRALARWLQELTPMDACDFDFEPDAAGRILVTLVESNGQRTTANSASEGTLRFLAMIAALLGPETASFYFFEELENGIHPTRLDLLVQLIEERVARDRIQLVASTHSPHLLGFLSPKAREGASLTYRLPGRAETGIQRIMAIPQVQQVLDRQNLTQLHASGWLEDAMVFLQPEEAE